MSNATSVKRIRLSWPFACIAGAFLASAALPAAADIAPAPDPTCNAWAKGGLPSVTPKTYTRPKKKINGTVVSDPVTVNYSFWGDIAYGDAVVWDEFINQNDWSSVDGEGRHYVRLCQRFDFFRPTATPPAAGYPLVIWAHPAGGSDTIPQKAPTDTNGDTFNDVVVPALAAGFAVASIEFRHPVGSFANAQAYNTGMPGLDDPVPGSLPPATTAPIPYTDVSDAIQYLRAKSHVTGGLNIDKANVFLVGQSRGSITLLNALIGEQAQAGASNWRSESSLVRAVHVYQAQTTYRKDEVSSLFLKTNIANFNEDYPPLYGDPGSSLYQAKQPSTVLPPLRMAYDATPVGNSDTSIAKQCYDSNAPYNRAREGLPPATPCAPSATIFDVHDPNYGKAMKIAYRDRGNSGQITTCFGVGKDHIDIAMWNYIAFFQNHLSSVASPGPDPVCYLP